MLAQVSRADVMKLTVDIVSAHVADNAKWRGDLAPKIGLGRRNGPGR